MPAYNTKPNYTLEIDPGQSIQVWSAEQPAPGNGGASASIPVALPPGRDGKYEPFGVDGFFSAAPGAFEIDIQAASVDADAQYQTIAGGNITTVDATNQTFHADAPNVNARFVRLLMRSRTNPVNITAAVTR